MGGLPSLAAVQGPFLILRKPIQLLRMSHLGGPKTEQVEIIILRFRVYEEQLACFD